jgi:hypothetical protein
MNSLFTPEQQDESEIFRPLRQMRSPLSMNAVKNYISERIGEITLWQKIQRLIFQTGAFTAIIATICLVNSPAGETKGILIHQSSASDLLASQGVALADNAPHGYKTGDASEMLTPLSIAQSIGKKEAMEIPIAPPMDKQEIASPISSISPITASAIVINSQTQSLSEIIAPKENNTSSLRPFAEMQGLANIDHTRMYGGGFSAGVIHDWQIVSLHFSDASGTRDDRKDDPSLSNISRIKEETGEQFALLFGGIIERGRFSTSLQFGPSYSMSVITSGLKGVAASNTLLNQNTLGMSAQISAGYRLTDNFSANVEGFFGYRSAFSKWLMVSIMIQP